MSLRSLAATIVTMAFTAEDASAIKQWMDEHAPAAACPLCRNPGNWGLAPAGAAVSDIFLALICQHCGYGLLLIRAAGEVAPDRGRLI
jgi:hypothetical protein